MSWLSHRGSCALPLIMVLVAFGCEREKPALQSQPPQPASAVDQAAQQAVDAMKMPMDKARSVEGTLDQAAGRTAEMVNSAGR